MNKVFPYTSDSSSYNSEFPSSSYNSEFPSALVPYDNLYYNAI